MVRQSREGAFEDTPPGIRSPTESFDFGGSVLTGLLASTGSDRGLPTGTRVCGVVQPSLVSAPDLPPPVFVFLACLLCKPVLDCRPCRSNAPWGTNLGPDGGGRA